MINIGVIGCSSIAEKSMIPSILETDPFRLVCVGSRSREKGERFARKFNCKATSYEGVIADDSIDAVYVCLPVSLHYQWGFNVLAAGRHLLLEKPFVESYDRAAELITLAQKNRVVAMESLTYVYHPLFAEVSNLLKDGVIGAIRQVDASFGFPFLPAGNIRNDRSLGGGAILDNLVYPLSFCLNLVGPGYLSRSFHIVHDNSRNIDARGFLRIDWKDVSANITYGFGFSYRNAVTVWGEEGILKIDRAFTRPKEMHGEISIEKAGEEGRSVRIDPANQFSLLLKAFSEKIARADRSGINEGDDVLRRMRIISEMYNASTAGSTIA